MNHRMLLLLLGSLLLITIHIKSGGREPTAEQAKDFLKLRGYDFDNESFFSAAAASDIQAVNAFIAAQVNPNVKRQRNGDTALAAAARRGDGKVVEALLRGSADVNAKGYGSNTPLLEALKNNHPEVANLLLETPGLDLEALDAGGMSPLMVAVWHEQSEIVDKLLSRGMDVNHTDNDGDSALHGAVMKRSVGLLKALLTRGANPNQANKVGGTPLMWAASYGFESIAEELLRAGASPLVKDTEGSSAYAWAVKNRRDGVARLLSEAEKR